MSQDEFEVGGRERERWSLRGVAIHLKHLLSLTPAIASQRGVVGGGLEKGQRCGDRAAPAPAQMDAGCLACSQDIEKG